MLYALFPVIAGGMALAALHMWAVMRPAAKFKDLPPSVKLQKVSCCVPCTWQPAYHEGISHASVR